MRRLSEAVACYRRALELKPDYCEAHNNLGSCPEGPGKAGRSGRLLPPGPGTKAGLCRGAQQPGQCLEGAGEAGRGGRLLPPGTGTEAGLCRGPQQPGHCPQGPGETGRSGRLLPPGAGTEAGLCRGAQQPGQCLEGPGEAGRSGRLLPPGPGTEARLCRGTQQPGRCLEDQGKLDEAVACYRRALELKPDFAEAHNNLGDRLQGTGEARRGGRLLPPGTGTEAGLCRSAQQPGQCLEGPGKLDEAVACYRRALELKPDYAEVHSNLGNALKDQGKLDEALACYRRALELKPDFAEGHGNLGSVLEEMGDLQGAEDSFRAALRHDSRFAFAHYKLAELLRGKLPEQDLAVQQRRLLEDNGVDGRATIVACTSAWPKSWTRGASMPRPPSTSLGPTPCNSPSGASAARSTTRKSTSLLVTRMIAVCTPDFFERVRGFGLESELPVFVVGLPRSGTTLIEQILASHSQVFGAGEIKLAGDTLAALGGQGVDPIEGLRRLDRETARRLASRHLERLRALDPAALRIVDKMPDNYLFLGLLASLFPRAKFIHCRRDLRDVAVSCWMTHFREIRWANDQQHIASRFHEYQRIMEHWRKVLPVPLLEVDYEETVADLEGVARRLVAWCGLEWEPGCLEFHRRSGRSERPAPSRCASRSLGHRWEDGSTTSTPWVRCSPGWKAFVSP